MGGDVLTAGGVEGEPVLWPKLGMSSSRLGFLVGGAVLESTAGGVLKSGSRREEPWWWVGILGGRDGVGVPGGGVLRLGPRREELWWLVGVHSRRGFEVRPSAEGALFSCWMIVLCELAR